MQRNPNVKPIEDRQLTGISLMILAVFFFTCLDAAAKWLMLSGMPAMQVVFSRYGLHLLIVLAVFLPVQRAALFQTQKLPLEITRALILLGSTTCNFMAVKFLPLTVTGSILFMTPIILAGLAVPLLGEHVGWRRWLAIIVGFIGILIIIRPGGGAFHWAVFLSLGSATFNAFYAITTRKLAGVDSVYTQQFYAALIATLAVMPFALGDWVWPQTNLNWMVFFSLGVLGFLGHLLITMAHRLAPASTLAPFAYPQILFMSAASWLVFSETPSLSIILGAPVVVGSGLYIWMRERQLAIQREAATGAIT